MSNWPENASFEHYFLVKEQSRKHFFNTLIQMRSQDFQVETSEIPDIELARVCQFRTLFFGLVNKI